MSGKNTNSPIAALAAIATLIVGFLWLGWRGLALAFVSGLIWSMGAIVNAERARNESKP